MGTEKDHLLPEDAEKEITPENIVAEADKLIQKFQKQVDHHGKRALFEKKESRQAEDVMTSTHLRVESATGEAWSESGPEIKEQAKTAEVLDNSRASLDTAVTATINYNASECLENIKEMIDKREDIISILTAISYMIPQPLGQLGPKGYEELNYIMQEVQEMMYESKNLPYREKAQKQFHRISTQRYAFSGQAKYAEHILQKHHISDQDHPGVYGILELKKGNYADALKHFKNSLVLLRERFSTETNFYQQFYYINRTATITNLMAIVSWKLGRVEDVLPYETASKNILDSLGNLVGSALIENNNNYTQLYSPNFSEEDSRKIGERLKSISFLFLQTGNYRNYIRSSLNEGINWIQGGILQSKGVDVDRAEESYTIGIAKLEEIERKAQSLEITDYLVEIRNVLAKGYQLIGKMDKAHGVNQKIFSFLEEQKQKNGGIVERSEFNLQYIIAGIHQVCIDHKVSIHDPSVSQNQDLLRALTEKIGAIIQEVFENDEYTKGHSLRVGPVAEIIFRDALVHHPKFQKYPRLIEILRGSLLGLAGVKHDIGKIGTPWHILHKKGALTQNERQEMNRHTLYGGHLIRQLAFDLPFGGGQIFELLTRVITEHHENWDGSGYPYGKKGSEIHLMSRIVAVADTLDALCSRRPYREPVSIPGTIKYINDRSGIQFDPFVVELMNNHFSNPDNIAAMEAIYPYSGKLDTVPAREIGRDPCDGKHQ